MPPATHRATLMSATCLATVTHVPTVQPGRGAAAMSMAAVSLASGLALSVPVPAEAAIIYSVGGSTTGTMSNPSSNTVTTSLTSPFSNAADLTITNNWLIGKSGSSTVTVDNLIDTKVTSTNRSVTFAFTSASLATVGANGTLSNGGSRVVTITATPTVRGTTITGGFTIRGSSPGVAAGNIGSSTNSDTTNVTVRVVGVAPVASAAAGATLYLLAGSGTSATTTFTITNTGNGNLDTGAGTAANLSTATNTFTTATGWATTTAALTNSTSLTGNGTTFGSWTAATRFQYTAQSARATNTATITSNFNNGTTTGNAAGSITTTLTGVTVAPIATTSTTTASGTQYVLAGSGATRTVTLKVSNTGDGSRVGASLTGTLSNTAGTGFSSTTAAGTFNLADGVTGPAATTLTQTLTYTAEATRSGSVRTASSVATFSNGSADGKNSAAASATVALSAQTVAPQNTITATGTTLYALPGKTASGSLVIQNVGDGSFLSKTLDGTLTTTITAGKGIPSIYSGTTNFSLADGKTGPAATTLTQTLTYYGLTRGSSTSATVTASFTNGNSSGNNTGQTVTTTFVAKTVAPEVALPTSVSFGTQRVGTKTSQTVTVKNAGDGNLAGADNGTTILTNLRGTVGSASGIISGAGGAVNLTDGTTSTYTFTYAPTARGITKITVGADMVNGHVVTNSAAKYDIAMSGTAVAPVYDAKLNGNAIANSGTVGFVSWGGAAIQTSDLLISNITPDAPSSLTDLTLTFSIIGDATKEFQLSFDGGKSYADYSTASSPITVAATAFQGVKVQFTNKVSGGDGFAQLRVATDEGAPLGGSGAIYIYNLSAIPEPGTLAVLGVGLLGLAVSRQRRRGRAFAALTAPPQQEDPPPPTAR